MSRKILFSLCIFLFSVLSAFAFSGCKEPLEELAPPGNLRVEKRILYWDEVENATGYVLNIGEEEFTVTDCSFPLYSFTADGELCIVDVAAIGDRKAYNDSSFSRIEISLDAVKKIEHDENGLKFTLLEDKSGYEVSRGFHTLEGTIAIPSFWRNYPVKRIAERAFVVTNTIAEPFLETNCNSKTTGFILPNTLESIGSEAFAYCVRIEEIIIPDSVKSIERSAFDGCNHLKKVTIPKGIKTIPTRCFANTPLEEIIIPDTVEEIGQRAFACETNNNLLPGQVLHIVSDLSSVVIPNSVTIIESEAFLGRENLIEITLPNTLEWLNINVFHETAWHLSQSDGLVILGNVVYQYIGEMPKNAVITIPENVKAIAGHAFYKQDNLKKIIIPMGIKLSGDGIFAYCSNLTEVILPADLKELPASTFNHTTSLKTITIPDTVSLIGNAAFASSGIEEIYIPSSVRTIKTNAFTTCPNLHTVYIDNGVKTIENNAFAYCPNMINIHLPDTLKVYSRYLFNQCGAESIVIPIEVEEIQGRAFAKCENLQHIYYEGSLVEWKIITAKFDSNLSQEHYISKAKVYYYSEKAPETEGNFWRYVDGVPTIW